MASEIEIELAHALNSWGGALIQAGNFEGAIETLRAARDIYFRHRDRNPVGRAESLTNYALALKTVGLMIDAKLALQEALEIATSSGHSDQIRRIQAADAQLGDSLREWEDTYASLIESANYALREERYGTAYLRFCICAKLAGSKGDFRGGLRALEMAFAIEPRLESHDLNPARARTLKARLLGGAGWRSGEIIGILISGAYLWLARLKQPLLAGDFATITAEMHDHFRMLARLLLDAGRVEEALTAFEAGRALAHSVEVDRGIFDGVVAANPFSPDGKAVSTEILEQAQALLSKNEVFVVFAALPPDLVVFVVGVTGVNTHSTPVGSDFAQREQFIEQLGLIPIRLQERVGERALPRQIIEIARALTASVGSRIVRALMPYAELHSVPWRAVLRHVGIPWSQLRCGVEFGMLLRTTMVNSQEPLGCIALGYGSTGIPPDVIDLGDEARQFADAYGKHGLCVVPCSGGDVKQALLSKSTVLISCHGSAGTGFAEGQLVLYLSGGGEMVDSVIPEQVAAPVVILSACESGVYRTASGDFPVGAAASFIRAGARYCVGARFRLNARFSASFFRLLALELAQGVSMVDAFSKASEACEEIGFEPWQDLACVELMGGP
ncbi:CHAT domain-containing protein [Corallococcus exercitus]|uniref:CHAT domain-containing protein n=1 Tax=Corallococcus exercitus TaxID=2316736 RepID=UPI001ABF55EF|nr:CHAT domain-containing protein [Corallococcus exercitus]